MKYIYLFATTILIVISQVAFAGPCETVSKEGTRLELVDFGIAYSEDFKFSSQDDRLDLYGGVCIKRETGDVWQLEADSIVIENASVELELRAQSVSFQFDGWILTAETLLSSTDFFQFEVVDLQKADMKINATNLKLDLMTDKFTLSDVSAIYQNDLQISGQTMNITENEVVFQDAFVTTCICEEDNLYEVSSPTIIYDSVANTLTLSQADLMLLDSTIPLGKNYSLGSNIDLNFPTPFLDYSDDLELALKNIVLASGVTADIGAQGVDADHEFNPYGLLKLNLSEANSPGIGGKLTGVIGKSVNGFQGDLNYVTSLPEGFSLDMGTRNHAWAAAENLHEAYVGLSRRDVPLNNVLETGILEVVPRIFAAYTSQEIATEPVVGPRLGMSVSNSFAYGTAQQGLIRFAVVPEATYYPSQDAFQYAVTVRPSLFFSSDGFSFNTSYTHKFTNSASPFSTDADKASEVRTLNVSMGFSETSTEGNTFGFSTNTTVDFLQNSEVNQSPVRTLGLNLNSTIKGSETSSLEFKPYLNAELARVVTGIADAGLDNAYNKDYFQLGMDSFFDDWELGLRARFNPTVQEDEEFVEVLEMGLGLPITDGELLLKPYVGLNFASLLTDTYTFDVSTYGLSASYECCGDASAFFQIRDGNLSTGLNLPF